MTKNEESQFDKRPHIVKEDTIPFLISNIRPQNVDYVTRSEERDNGGREGKFEELRKNL